jgi:hypothetical protein
VLLLLLLLVEEVDVPPEPPEPLLELPDNEISLSDPQPMAIMNKQRRQGDVRIGHWNG